MKELFLLLIMLAVVAFGYYIIARVDYFMDESQRYIEEKTRDGRSKIRIGAESPSLLKAVSGAVSRCADTDPHLAIFLSSAKGSCILERLREDRIDIALLKDAGQEGLDEEYTSMRIPWGRTGERGRVFGRPAEKAQEDTYLQVVWKKDRRSKDRDRVIFALENEHCRLKSGYADYMGK